MGRVLLFHGYKLGIYLTSKLEIDMGRVPFLITDLSLSPAFGFANE